MIQLQKDDGSWSDCFVASYKPHQAAQNVANKYRTQTRIVNRKGKVIYSTEPNRMRGDEVGERSPSEAGTDRA